MGILISKIYTKTGDKGRTSLISGERIKKHHPRIQAIGAIDEANSSLGIAIHYANDKQNKIKRLLKTIQNDLFDLGADIAMPTNKSTKTLRIISNQVKYLEFHIDFYNKLLNPLKSFIIPGGCIFSAHLHMTRTIVRRAERYLCIIKQTKVCSKFANQYINRLSDLLFVIARYTNSQKEGDIMWIPGLNRKLNI